MKYIIDSQKVKVSSNGIKLLSSDILLTNYQINTEPTIDKCGNKSYFKLLSHEDKKAISWLSKVGEALEKWLKEFNAYQNQIIKRQNYYVILYINFLCFIYTKI